MKKICFLNQKGGVGKTTTTFQTAAYLTKHGKKVLMIDLDPQGNLTTCLGVNTTDLNTVTELMLGEAMFAETVMSTKYGDLLPSDDALGYREMEISSRMAREKLLANALKGKINKYEYILIDCPPAINVFVYNALMLTDEVVVVSEMGIFSAAGCGKMITTISAAAKAYDKKIKITGILFTKNNNTVLAKSVHEQVQQVSKTYGVGVFNTQIGTFPSVVGASQASCESVFDFEPDGKCAQQYAAAVEEITGERFGESAE